MCRGRGDQVLATAISVCICYQGTLSCKISPKGGPRCVAGYLTSAPFSASEIMIIPRRLQGVSELYGQFLLCSALPFCDRTKAVERASGPCRSSGPHRRRFPANAGCGLSAETRLADPSLKGMRPPKLGAPGSAFLPPRPLRRPLRGQTRGPLLPAGTPSDAPKSTCRCRARGPRGSAAPGCCERNASGRRGPASTPPPQAY